VNGGGWVSVNLHNVQNAHTFPARTFRDGDRVTWRVQTVSNLGTSDFSESASFVLASTPPFAPLLVYPLNVAVDATNGAVLEWRYNSRYDLRASRFDVRYRIQGANWTNCTTDGTPSIRTNAINTQSAVEWQVRATGQLGDTGPWSEIGLFWTIGTPDAPAIVNVRPTNRPVVTFSSANAMSWEMVFHDSKGDIYYDTGDVTIDSNFTYQPDKLFVNGGYSVKMRVRNEYGLYSDWAYLAFTVSSAAAPAVRLESVENNTSGIKLSASVEAAFQVEKYCMHVYRSERNASKFVQIAQLLVSDKITEYIDFTAASGIGYEYFVRLIALDGNGYSDSNKVVGTLNFRETILSSTVNGNIAVHLGILSDSESCKIVETAQDKGLARFFGKQNPSVEFGCGLTKRITLSFLCKMTEYENLVELSQSDELLILRDKRFGVCKGVISGFVRAADAGPNHVAVSFTFVEAGN
jgi:hypothetical protein